MTRRIVRLRNALIKETEEAIKLKEIEAFVGDENALREHFEEIVRGRERQREEAQLQGSE